MREIKHNTSDEVRDAISEALASIEICEVPDDLRAAAFQFAAERLISKQVFYHPADQAPLVETATAISQVRH